MHKDELWQEYDFAGRPLKNGGRPAHTESSSPAILHGVARVWLTRKTTDGKLEVLFQKRAPQVKNGGKYDASAGGHINYQEAPEDAAIRESKEEIGANLKIDNLIFFSSNTTDKAIFYDYLYDWTKETDYFHFDDHEVSMVRWVEFSMIDDFIQKEAKATIKKDHLETTALLKKKMQNLYGNH